MSQQQQDSVKSGVSVSMTYWIGAATDDNSNSSAKPTLHKVFSSSEAESSSITTTTTARIGLPEGVEPTKPPAGSYHYSGMHDHGPLVPPKEGGEVAQLLGCVQAAKKFSDDYLTQVIQDEKDLPKEQ